MEIGTEIGQKIRAAIKAKLVDLGAYVDDELPDYIMVMVANKKTQAQMTEDLNLFLGNNTDKFTSWLNGLLSKLQAITADSSQPPTAKETEQQLRVVEESQAEFSSAPKGSKPKPRRSLEQVVETEPPAKEEPDLEPEININVEQDEFAEEAQAAKEADLKKKQEEQDRADKQKKKQSPPKVKDRIVQKKSAVVTQKEVTSSEVAEERVVSIVQHKEPPRAIVKGSVVKRPHRSQASSSSSNNRRRGPGSVLGSVVKHDVEEEEEGYDPYNPAIGKVASVIRVTERKSSVPKSMQATKSLLMKAMKEAEVSVEKTTKRQPLEPAIVRPIIQRIGTAARMTSTPKVQEQLFSRSKREEIFHRFKIDMGEDSTEEEEDSSLYEDSTASISYTASQSVESPDSRLVQPGDHASEYDESDILTLQESTDDLDIPDVSDINTEKELKHKSKPEPTRAASPKFVVTLEGVDPNDLGIEEEEEEEMPRNVRAGKRKGQPQQFTVNLEDADEDEGSPPKVQRLQERCRFWPGCKNGDQCPYHHPTVQCKAFPKCSYGDRCLFIHPNCKFDAKCTRPDCPFTHASKRAPGRAPTTTVVIQPIKVPIYAPMKSAKPRPSHPSQVKCRFFPKCTNMNCPFLHPKPCRFGISCNNKATCMFAHPELPGKGALKWEAGKTQASKTQAGAT